MNHAPRSACWKSKDEQTFHGLPQRRGGAPNHRPRPRTRGESRERPGEIEPRADDSFVDPFRASLMPQPIIPHHYMIQLVTSMVAC